MQYYNIVFSALLLLMVAVVYQHKRFTPKAQAFIAFIILVILMAHYMILMNVKLFKGRKDRFDESFLADLDFIKNTDQSIYATPVLQDLNSCVDLNGLTNNLKTYFTGKGTVVIRAQSNIPIKEITYNLLLDRYVKRQILNFYMNFQTYTPPLSIFNLGHLESKFLYYKILKEVKNYPIVIFHDPKDNKQLEDLLAELREHENDKLFIVLINEELKLSKDNPANVISCYDLDNEEFKRYVTKRQPDLKNLTTDEIIDAVGKDPNTIEELFKNQTKLTKSDLEKFLNQYSVELRLHDMDDCQVLFLKNMLVEYYKSNHRTQHIPVTKLIHKSLRCKNSTSMRVILQQLYKQKVIISNGKNVRFYSTVVRNALMRYFRDNHRLGVDSR